MTELMLLRHAHAGDPMEWTKSDDIRPLTAGLQSLRGMWQTSWPLVAAGSLLAAVPPVAVFFLLQRQLIAGLTYGTRAAG